MTRSARHRLNALICFVIGAHAVFWFAAGHAATATNFRIGLFAAQAVVGLAGAFWFWRRARG